MDIAKLLLKFSREELDSVEHYYEGVMELNTPGDGENIEPTIFPETPHVPDEIPNLQETPSRSSNFENFSEARKRQIIMTEKVVKKATPVFASLFIFPIHFLKSMKSRTIGDLKSYITNLFNISTVLLVLTVFCMLFDIKRFVLVYSYQAVLACIILSVISFILRTTLFKYAIDASPDIEDAVSDASSDIEFEFDETSEITTEEYSEPLATDAIVEDPQSPEHLEYIPLDVYESRTHQIICTAKQDDILYSRKYLMDYMKKILPNCTDNFSDVKKYTYKDNLFKVFHICFNNALRITFLDKYKKGSGQVLLDQVVESFSGYTIKIIKEGNLSPITFIDVDKNREAIEEHFKSSDEDLGEEPDKILMRVADKGAHILITLRKTDLTKVVTIADTLLKPVVKEFFLNEKKLLPISLGVRDNNSVLYIDLFEFPHVLVMGGTGGGKSWLTSMFLTTLAAFNPPSRVSFIILDPKDSPDLNPFKELPHTAIFNGNPLKFVSVLEAVKAEAERRKEILHSYNVDIKDYYKIWKPGTDMPVLPVLVLVIDELNSLIEDLPNEDHEKLKGLIYYFCVKCRSFGIKVLGIPQKPMHDILPTTCRDQMKLKIALEVTEEGSEFMFRMKNTGLKLTGGGECGVALNMADKPVQVRAVAVAPDTPYMKSTIGCVVDFWRQVYLTELLPDMPKFTAHMTRYDKNINYATNPTVSATLDTFSSQTQQTITEARKVSLQKTSSELDKATNTVNLAKTEPSSTDDLLDLDLIDFETDDIDSPNVNNVLHKLTNIDAITTHKDGFSEHNTVDFNTDDSITDTVIENVCTLSDFEDTVDKNKSISTNSKCDIDYTQYYIVTIRPSLADVSVVDSIFSATQTSSKKTMEDIGLHSLDLGSDVDGIEVISQKRVKDLGGKPELMSVYEYVRENKFVTMDELESVFSEEEIAYAVEGGEIVYEKSSGKFVTF